MISTENNPDGSTNTPNSLKVVSTQDTFVKNYFEKNTIGYILKNGNRKSRRYALSQLKKRK